MLRNPYVPRVGLRGCGAPRKSAPFRLATTVQGQHYNAEGVLIKNPSKGKSRLLVAFRALVRGRNIHGKTTERVRLCVLPRITLLRQETYVAKPLRMG